MSEQAAYIFILWFIWTAGFVSMVTQQFAFWLDDIAYRWDRIRNG